MGVAQLIYRPDGDVKIPPTILGLFLDLFTSTHQELSEIDTLIDETRFHSANSIVSEIVN